MNKLMLAAAVTGATLLLTGGCHRSTTDEYRVTVYEDETTETYGTPAESETPRGESPSPQQYQEQTAPHPLEHPIQATSRVGWQVVDDSGKVIGHVADAAGTVVDGTGKVIGHIAEGGANVITDTGETIGKLLEPGNQP